MLARGAEKGREFWSKEYHSLSSPAMGRADEFGSRCTGRLEGKGWDVRAWSSAAVTKPLRLDNVQVLPTVLDQ